MGKYIQMDFREIGCDDMVWIHLAQDMVLQQNPVYMVINLQVP